ASGGVLGILAAFGLLYPREPIYLYFFVPVQARWVVLGLAALDLYAGVTGTQAGVANFAHLGGMLTGFLLIQHWRGRLPWSPRRRA
ncbi:MAG TPA: rhomboid family intramembrane serine protease, partial [Rubricoccaceae bacterium]|nr:rhomboid family intramembrane serine protease [Rubricoccaceae bacterium]